MGGQAFLGAFPESRTKPVMYMSIDPNERKIHYHRSDQPDKPGMLEYDDVDLLNGITAALVDMRMK